MNILLVPDKYKGSLTALSVCNLITQGLLDEQPHWNITTCPISDGGDGFSEVLLTSGKGKWITCPARDALGHNLEARYVLCNSTAVIEMADASGIRHIPNDQLDIWHANSAGAGDMIRHAVESSAVKRIIIGIGGSASNDAGCGMMEALGAQFLDTNRKNLRPCPASFKKLESVDLSNLIPLPEIIVACDVENPLLGPNGATSVYAQQKGASVADLPILEELLCKIVTLTAGEQQASLPGSGAAGGLGYGLIKFAGASLIAGFDLIAEEINLREKIEQADVIITGEGRLDAQTLHGKGPAGIAKMAREAGKPVMAIAGSIEGSAEKLFDHTLALHQPELRTIEQTIAISDQLLVERARELAAYLARTR